jgi:16S rRNA (guanine(527)-N(7))-methyltransferase RsmG
MKGPGREGEEGIRLLNIITVMESCGVGDIEKKVDQIEKYIEMLRVRRDWAGLTSRHMSKRIEGALVESASVFKVEKCTKKDVVEIGSGGGLLGIIVSITCPQWEVTMTERASRKSAFLAEAVGKIGIDNAFVFHGEARGLIGEREFDLCLSRASGRLVEIVPIAMGLLKPGGRYIAIKQMDVGWELEAALGSIEENGGTLQESGWEGCQPGGETGGFSLVVIEKS